MITIQTNKWMKIKKYRNLIKFNKKKKKTHINWYSTIETLFLGGGMGWLVQNC